MIVVRFIVICEDLSPGCERCDGIRGKSKIIFNSSEHYNSFGLMLLPDLKILPDLPIVIHVSPPPMLSSVVPLTVPPYENNGEIM